MENVPDRPAIESKTKANFFFTIAYSPATSWKKAPVLRGDNSLKLFCQTGRKKDPVG